MDRDNQRFGFFLTGIRHHFSRDWPCLLRRYKSIVDIRMDLFVSYAIVYVHFRIPLAI